MSSCTRSAGQRAFMYCVRHCCSAGCYLQGFPANLEAVSVVCSHRCSCPLTAPARDSDLHMFLCSLFWRLWGGPAAHMAAGICACCTMR